MKVSIQETLYPGYPDKGTSADSIRARMDYRLLKAKAKQQTNKPNDKVVGRIGCSV